MIEKQPFGVSAASGRMARLRPFSAISPEGKEPKATVPIPSRYRFQSPEAVTTVHFRALGESAFSFRPFLRPIRSG